MFSHTKLYLKCQRLHNVAKESQFNKVDIHFLKKITKEEKHKGIVLN